MSEEEVPEMKIIREVSELAEDFYDEAVKLGDHAAFAFQDLNRSNKNKHRAQMTGLETIAESTLKVSDVFDYIKRQTARQSYWRTKLPLDKINQESSDEKLAFGLRLKKVLEKDLGMSGQEICERLGIQDKQLQRRIHLLLMRQFIRKMVVEYELQVSLTLGEGTDNEIEA